MRETKDWPWRVSTTYWEALTPCPGTIYSGMDSCWPPEWVFLLFLMWHKYHLIFSSSLFSTLEGSLMPPVTTPALLPQLKGKMGKMSLKPIHSYLEHHSPGCSRFLDAIYTTHWKIPRLSLFWTACHSLQILVQQCLQKQNKQKKNITLNADKKHNIRKAMTISTEKKWLLRNEKTVKIFG